MQLFLMTECSSPSKRTMANPRGYIEDNFSCYFILGTRESAFTYAISTAGVAYYIARQCAIDGDLKSCGCSRERRPKEVDKMAKEEEGVQFDWGGCGDNIQFGTSYAKQFLNAGEGGGQEHRDMRDQERARMNKHNNEVGVQVGSNL